MEKKITKIEQERGNYAFNSFPSSVFLVCWHVNWTDWLVRNSFTLLRLKKKTICIWLKWWVVYTIVRSTFFGPVYIENSEIRNSCIEMRQRYFSFLFQTEIFNPTLWYGWVNLIFIVENFNASSAGFGENLSFLNRFV